MGRFPSLGALCWLNGSAWALASVPLFALLVRVPLDVPRFGRAFYIAYPAHLAVLVVGASLFGV